MTRGQLAKVVSVNTETIRYYEQKGLIPKPKRSPSGYRQYSEDFIVRIRFIKRSQELGFTLKEILELLSLRIDPDSNRADVKTQVDQKIEEITAKIDDLQKMKSSLSQLTACCGGQGSSRDCPILDSLEA
jgi:Hg(II)-responsive transcriptional regulator